MDESPERIGQARFLELEARYKKLYDWAKDQEFVVVYRAEGAHAWDTQKDAKISRSASPQLVGSWYTDRYSMITSRYIPEIKDLSGGEVKVYALIIPKSVLEGRDPMDKGLNQVNIVNQELTTGRQEISDPSEVVPFSLESYLDQFTFVKEFKSLKAKYIKA